MIIRARPYARSALMLRAMQAGVQGTGQLEPIARTGRQTGNACPAVPSILISAYGYMYISTDVTFMHDSNLLGECVNYLMRDERDLTNRPRGQTIGVIREWLQGPPGIVVTARRDLSLRFLWN